MTAYLRFLSFALFLALLLNGCQDNSEICVEIQFHPVNHIPEGAWLKIDDLTFHHTPHGFEWSVNSFFPNEDGEGEFAYIPTSSVFFYHPKNNEKRVVEKMTNFEVCRRLGKKVSNQVVEEKPQYKIVNPKEYLVNGILKIQRTDNKKISFSHSEDNPVFMSYKRIKS